jgi:hypothetical protein
MGGGGIYIALRTLEVATMVIKFNLGALKHVKLHDYVVRFLLGGAVTVATGLIAKAFGPVTGGLFLALPAIFPASATLLEKHERDKKRRAGIIFTLRGRLAAALDARGAAMGAIAMFAFAGFAWQMLPRTHLAVGLSCSMLAWLLLASLLWYIRKRHPWSPPRTKNRD